MDKQLKLDPDTGEILEIYQQPSGKTDAVAVRRDVDYSICGDDKKRKNEADKKMVKALDSMPWKERQWGHAGVRNAIAVKQKLGLDLDREKIRRVALNKKKLEKAPSKENLSEVRDKVVEVENWQQNLANELHKTIKRRFIQCRVYANGILKPVLFFDLSHLGSNDPRIALYFTHDAELLSTR